MFTHESRILNTIFREWQALPDHFRPWGAWIRRYPMLLDGQSETDASVIPQAVWFLNERGVQQRSVWEWRRFFVVQCEQPWCGRFWSKESVGVFGEPHQIGLAAFALLADGDYYLETIWAGRYGHGWKITFEPDGSLSLSQELWIS